MKPMNAFTAVATFALLALGLAGCGKTSNSSTPAATPASVCSRSWDGTMRDQYGRACGGTVTNNNCLYNASTGQYSSYGGTGTCISNGYYDGYNSLPYNGQYGNTYFTGCQGWTQYYGQMYPGTQYIPVDLGGGQMVCMNVSYLYQQMPTYNWNQSYNNYMSYGTPLLTCSYYSCGGNYYNPYNSYAYSCQTSINLGFNFGYGGVGFGMCM